MHISERQRRLGDKHKEIDDRVIAQFKSVFDEVGKLCKELRLKATAARLGQGNLLADCWSGRTSYRGMLEPELRLLWELSLPELKDRQFIFIPLSYGLCFPRAILQPEYGRSMCNGPDASPGFSIL
jgi:hypothetical protein